MLKRTKTNLIVRALLFALIGVLCLISPKGTLLSIAWILGIVLIIAAVATFLISHKRNDGSIAPLSLISSILMAVVGLLIIIRPQIIAILLGVYLLFEGIDFCINDALRCKKAGIKHWWLLLAIGILVALLGLWAVCTPWVGETMLSIIVGIGCLGIAVNCVTALTSIERVENFFAEVKKGLTQTSQSNDETFVEAEVVE